MSILIPLLKFSPISNPVYTPQSLLYSVLPFFFPFPPLQIIARTFIIHPPYCQYSDSIFISRLFFSLISNPFHAPHSSYPILPFLHIPFLPTPVNAPLHLYSLSQPSPVYASPLSPNPSLNPFLSTLPPFNSEPSFSPKKRILSLI